MEEVLAEVLVGDPVRRFVDVFGQLADGADVGLLGPGREPSQRHVLEHALAQRCHDDLLSREHHERSFEGRSSAQTRGLAGLPYPPQAD